MSKLLTQQKVTCDVEGELVRLTIADLVIRMGYEDALKISQAIRVQAKRAKRLAGDGSRHWSSIGVLDCLPAGASQEELERMLPRAFAVGANLRSK